MPLLPLIGHHALRDRLDGQIARGALPASILLQGPPGVGKQRLALWLGQRLLCTGDTPPCGECQHCRYVRMGAHPDLRWYFPLPRLKDSGEPSLEDVEELYQAAMTERFEAQGLYAHADGSAALYLYVTRLIVHQATRTPAMARRKVFVVGDADRMVPQASSPESANAFLKLLEEPPADTTLILTTSEPGALLPTIRSRVVIVRVPVLTDAEVREFLAAPDVRGALGERAVSDDDLVAMAGGAPGSLLSATDRSAAVARARALLEATHAGTDARLRAAFTQGSSKARGAFSDVLDALTVLLRDAARDAAASGDDARALASAKGVVVVEDAKRAAEGNVTPQLITADLLSRLAELGA